LKASRCRRSRSACGVPASWLHSCAVYRSKNRAALHG